MYPEGVRLHVVSFFQEIYIVQNFRFETFVFQFSRITLCHLNAIIRQCEMRMFVLHAFFQAKLRYNPIELDPEDMCRMASEQPQVFCCNECFQLIDICSLQNAFWINCIGGFFVSPF
jgi:hypothetical protein